MSDLSVYKINSELPEDTINLGRNLGQVLKGGEVIELASDLGGGKTTFVRGLAAGFGSQDKVGSPTFTLNRIYTKGRKEIHHFDFYRLNDPGLMSIELHEAMESPDNVVVVEWADIVSDVLPKNRLAVKFEQSKNGRIITFSAPKELEYLIDAVKS